jgi:NADH dehydrogenase
MKDLVLHGGLPVTLPVPVIPVPGNGQNRFQPIYVGDLTACLMQCLTGSTALNETVEVGGALPVTFDEIVRSFARRLGIKKPLLHTPLWLLNVMAPVVGLLPNPPFTKDQLKNLSRDNTCDISKMKLIFGIEPKYFEETLSIILA